MVDKIPSEIRKIELDDASFKDTKTVVEHLTFVNFFFGNNGCGKSTIAQAIKSGRGITYAPDKTAANYIFIWFMTNILSTAIFTATEICPVCLP